VCSRLGALNVLTTFASSRFTVDAPERCRIGV
jgi:hypothetical protein